MQSALDRLGCRHPIGGRPLPGDALPDLAAVVEAVLARDPAGVTSFPVAPRVVVGIVQRWHLWVEPWPFTALVQAAGPPRPGPEPLRGP